MNRKSIWIVATITLTLAVVSGVALSALDKYKLKLPNGLAFSDFKGYGAGS